MPPGWLSGGALIVRKDGAILEANAAIVAWAGMAGGTAGKRLIDCLRFPAWREPVEGLLQATAPFGVLALSGSGPAGPEWYSLEAARHGEVVFLRLNSTLAPAEPGEPAEQALYLRLTRAEAQLQAFIERWPGVVFHQRPDFAFQWISPRIEELTGEPPARWRAQPELFWKIVHESDLEELQQHLKRPDQDGEGVVRSFRIRHLKTGRVTYILEHRKTLRGENGETAGYEGVWLDVTRQTVAEKRLSSAAWKETLALLTMGLAHDFSNIMAGILSLSETFQAQVEKEHPFQEGLALIQQNARQASQLVQRILNLHRGRVGERNYHNLNDLVADTVELVRKVVPRRIVIQTDLATEALPLYVDAVEFRQVFINLTLNAVEAMPQRGHLVFRTSLHREPLALPHRHGKLPRLPWVCLSVEDDGCGIPARNLGSIFDPFFTTKALNKGSGLGLYNARLFVDKHEGVLGVESEERVRTVFRVCLPLADFTEAEQLLTRQETRRHTLLLLGGTGVTLDSTAEFLRQHGFYVVTAGTAEGARELLRSPDFQFSGVMLLITGNDPALETVFQSVREQGLPFKCILQIVSRNQDEVENALLRAADLVLAPDVPPTELAARLQSLLDGAAARSL
jgi:PAS domain S-box-containing protein